VLVLVVGRTQYNGSASWTPAVVGRRVIVVLRAWIVAFLLVALQLLL